MTVTATVASACLSPSSSTLVCHSDGSLLQPNCITKKASRNCSVKQHPVATRSMVDDATIPHDPLQGGDSSRNNLLTSNTNHGRPQPRIHSSNGLQRRRPDHHSLQRFFSVPNLNASGDCRPDEDDNDDDDDAASLSKFPAVNWSDGTASVHTFHAAPSTSVKIPSSSVGRSSTSLSPRKAPTNRRLQTSATSNNDLQSLTPVLFSTRLANNNHMNSPPSTPTTASLASSTSTSSSGTTYITTQSDQSVKTIASRQTAPPKSTIPSALHVVKQHQPSQGNQSLNFVFPKSPYQQSGSNSTIVARTLIDPFASPSDASYACPPPPPPLLRRSVTEPHLSCSTPVTAATTRQRINPPNLVAKTPPHVVADLGDSLHASDLRDKNTVQDDSISHLLSNQDSSSRQLLSSDSSHSQLRAMSSPGAETTHQTPSGSETPTTSPSKRLKKKILVKIKTNREVKQQPAFNGRKKSAMYNQLAGGNCTDDEDDANAANAMMSPIQRRASRRRLPAMNKRSGGEDGNDKVGHTISSAAVAALQRHLEQTSQGSTANNAAMSAQTSLSGSTIVSNRSLCSSPARRPRASIAGGSASAAASAAATVTNSLTGKSPPCESQSAATAAAALQQRRAASIKSLESMALAEADTASALERTVVLTTSDSHLLVNSMERQLKTQQQQQQCQPLAKNDAGTILETTAQLLKRRQRTRSKSRSSSRDRCGHKTVPCAKPMPHTRSERSPSQSGTTRNRRAIPSLDDVVGTTSSQQRQAMSTSSRSVGSGASSSGSRRPRMMSHEKSQSLRRLHTVGSSKPEQEESSTPAMTRKTPSGASSRAQCTNQMKLQDGQVSGEDYVGQSSSRLPAAAGSVGDRRSCTKASNERQPRTTQMEREVQLHSRSRSLSVNREVSTPGSTPGKNGGRRSIMLQSKALSCRTFHVSDKD